MPVLIAVVMASLLFATGQRPAPVVPTPSGFRFFLGKTPDIRTDGSKSSATLFCTPQVEGGSAAIPFPVTITVHGKDGKDSELALKQLLAQLAEKQGRSKP